MGSYSPVSDFDREELGAAATQATPTGSAGFHQEAMPYPSSSLCGNGTSFLVRLRELPIWNRWPASLVPPKRRSVAAFVSSLVIFVLFFAMLGSNKPGPRLYGYKDLQLHTATTESHFSSSDTPKPKLCIIGRTYSKQFSYLPLFLLSLWHGGFPNIQVFLLNTDNSMPTAEMEKAATLVNQLVGQEDYATFLPFPLHPPGDYGYGVTDDILEWLYVGPGREKNCEYITFSNGDNLFAQTFSNYLGQAFEKKADLIGWDFISHHVWHEPKLNFDGKQYTLVQGSNVHKSVEFKIASIDLSAAMFRLDFLREHNLTFISTGPYGWTSDGQFIEAANARAKVTFIQHATLLLHQ